MAFKYKEYEESDALKKLAKEYNAKKAAAPQEYRSQFDTQIADVLGRIKNREKFSYDASTDPFAKQYEDIYRRQAKLGQQDAMGQAAALTGGYGNSYAQSVGQQTYNQTMQNMSNIYPELYKLAYSRYQQEGQDMLDQYNLLAAQDADAYAKHRDLVGDYQTDLARLASEYQNLKDEDYSRYLSDRDTAYDSYAADLDYNAAIAKIQSEAGEDEGNGLYSYSRTVDDEKGSYAVFHDPNGKEVKVETGVNPYTRTKNPDAKYGTFNNGYQPNNIVFKKENSSGDIEDVPVKLEKTGDTQYVKGRSQQIWQTTYKGQTQYWLWDGEENDYVDVTDDYLEYKKSEV